MTISFLELVEQLRNEMHEIIELVLQFGEKL